MASLDVTAPSLSRLVPLVVPKAPTLGFGALALGDVADRPGRATVFRFLGLLDLALLLAISALGPADLADASGAPDVLAAFLFSVLELPRRPLLSCVCLF